MGAVSATEQPPAHPVLLAEAAQASDEILRECPSKP